MMFVAQRAHADGPLPTAWLTILPGPDVCYYCTEQIRWTHALNLCPVTHHRCIYTGESS